MKGSDKAIVMGVIVAVVLAAFYFKVLSPKREKASSLNKEIAGLQTNVDQQKQTAAFAEDARKRFPVYYGRLVVMGKAVPSDSGAPSLLVQLNSLAHRTRVDFDQLELGAGGTDTATASAPTSAPPATTGTATTSTTPSSTPTAATAPTPATETSAANLPLGATVGGAGLPTMPYKLSFSGRYFDVADFLKGIDDMVHVRGTDQVAADGRLLTVNAFSLSMADGSAGSSPLLDVHLNVTSYITPPDQGLTAGATPSGPSLAQPQVQPVSATVTP